MENLKEFFDKMHDVDFPYVVLRNFEGLPEDATVKGHGDIDILVYDFKHFKELFPQIKSIYPFPRVYHKMTLVNFNVYLDIRYVGDGYYPMDFEMQIIENREYHPAGFFIPEPNMFRIALVYHTVHHKNRNDYKKWIGNGKVEEYLESLKKSQIGYSIPEDPSVGKFHQYWKGATAVVVNNGKSMIKSQIGYGSYDLIHNEFRILSEIDSNHFPKVLGKKFNQKTSNDEITIENCGERLTMENLPQDWKNQLVEIINDLRLYKIQHRDIKPDNLMVKEGIIKLIDFGWARFTYDDEDHPPKVLGIPYRPTTGFNDSFSMRKVIKEIEYKLEDQLV